MQEESGESCRHSLNLASDFTRRRTASASIQLVPLDQDLVIHSDYILSIVPPRDALATAKRIVAASAGINKSSPLYYLDLNAISPRSAREMSNLFESTSIRFLDGGVSVDTMYLVSCSLKT